MKNQNARFLTLMLATLLGFRGKAPAKKGKVRPDRYPDGFNKTRENARRLRNAQPQYTPHRLGPISPQNFISGGVL